MYPLFSIQRNYYRIDDKEVNHEIDTETNKSPRYPHVKQETTAVLAPVLEQQ